MIATKKQTANQGTTVRVDYGDATAPADPIDSRIISQSFPYTYGQPLAHFLRATILRLLRHDVTALDDEAASSLNSAYCYILQSDSTVFTWSGNLTSTVDEELMERMLDLIKPNLQTKSHKEGYESEQFLELLGGKTKYASNKIAKEAEIEPHLFACSFSNEDLKVTEIYSFTQDDLMTEDIFILSCHRELFVWIGKQVDTKNRTHALAIGESVISF